MVILNEKEVLDFLGLPSVPAKEWDGKTSFKDGVAIVNLYGGLQMYAIATFDSDVDTNPRIKKVFSGEPFYDIVKVFVVPTYMAKEEDVVDFDMDEQSKIAAAALLEEAKEMENKDVVENTPSDETQENEWVIEGINSLEEAKAFVKSYRTRHKIKGSLPKDEESIKLYLTVIKADVEKERANKKGKK